MMPTPRLISQLVHRPHHRQRHQKSQLSIVSINDEWGTICERTPELQGRHAGYGDDLAFIPIPLPIQSVSVSASPNEGSRGLDSSAPSPSSSPTSARSSFATPQTPDQKPLPALPLFIHCNPTSTLTSLLTLVDDQTPKQVQADQSQQAPGSPSDRSMPMSLPLTSRSCSASSYATTTPGHDHEELLLSPLCFSPLRLGLGPIGTPTQALQELQQERGSECAHIAVLVTDDLPSPPAPSALDAKAPGHPRSVTQQERRTPQAMLAVQRSSASCLAPTSPVSQRLYGMVAEHDAARRAVRDLRAQLVLQTRAARFAAKSRATKCEYGAGDQGHEDDIFVVHAAEGTMAGQAPLIVSAATPVQAQRSITSIFTEPTWNSDADTTAVSAASEPESDLDSDPASVLARIRALDLAEEEDDESDADANSCGSWTPPGALSRFRCRPPPPVNTDAAWGSPARVPSVITEMSEHGDTTI